MTYTHLTTDELVMIESYHHQSIPVMKVSKLLNHSHQMIYNVIIFLRQCRTALDYYTQYKENKKRCGRRRIILPKNQKVYIKQKVAQGWTPDVILGRAEKPIACSTRTLYRQFKDGIFDVTTLPFKGKRNIAEREVDYSDFKEEFRHIEGDTIVGVHHKSAVITLAERISKVIFTLEPKGRKAKDIETTMNQWFQSIPRNLFKSITFDCSKEFSNWKSLCNLHNIAIYFADPGRLSQRGLNEHP